MALENTFKLAKLTIRAFTNEERGTRFEDHPEFEVMFNPASFSMRHSNEFENQQGINTPSAKARFSYGRSKILYLNLVIDGTGVSDYGLISAIGRGSGSVSEQIDAFLDTCSNRNGEIHQPNFLIVNWGAGLLQRGFNCRLQSVDINYTSFDRDGSPLRAELNTTFIEDQEPTEQEGQNPNESPDLSHRRQVRQGDTLPLLCREIYGSAKHYIRVAQANELDDFRNLVPGEELIFPPFERVAKGSLGR